MPGLLLALSKLAIAGLNRNRHDAGRKRLGVPRWSEKSSERWNPEVDLIGLRRCGNRQVREGEGGSWKQGQLRSGNKILFGSSGASALFPAVYARIQGPGIGPRLLGGRDGCSVQGSGKAGLWLGTAIVARHRRLLIGARPRKSMEIHGDHGTLVFDPGGRFLDRSRAGLQPGIRATGWTPQIRRMKML